MRSRKVSKWRRGRGLEAGGGYPLPFEVILGQILCLSIPNDTASALTTKRFQIATIPHIVLETTDAF